jgi:hypothetical protein
MCRYFLMRCFTGDRHMIKVFITNTSYEMSFILLPLDCSNNVDRKSFVQLTFKKKNNGKDSKKLAILYAYFSYITDFFYISMQIWKRLNKITCRHFAILPSLNDLFCNHKLSLAHVLNDSFHTLC